MIFYYKVIKEMRIYLVKEIIELYEVCVGCFWHCLYRVVTKTADDIHHNWITNWNNFTGVDTVYYYDDRYWK